MNAMKLERRVSIHLLVVASMLVGMVLVPAVPAKAGMLGNFLSATRPLLVLAGKVGGAIAGASLCGAFCPPLGMIAGGVMGWIAGGIITGYATGSLKNLATVAGGAVGAMALGPGVVGAVGGFLLGGFLGRMAMNLLYKADCSITGGALFAKTNEKLSKWLGTSASATSASFSNTSGASSAGVSMSGAGIKLDAAAGTAGGNAGLIRAQEQYQKAYQTYVTQTQSGNDAAAQKAHQEYLTAYQEYQSLGGK